MGKIKIKHPSQNTDTKLKLLDILAKHNVYASRIIPLHDGFNVITSLEEETDILFDIDCLEDLHQNNFSPIMPPELKSKRTVILFGVDSNAISHSTEEIIHEIYRVNPYTEDMIDTVFKFPKGNTMKVTFKNTAPAMKSLEQGIKLFNTRVPPHQLQREEYIPVKTCMRCYAVEDHNTPDCPKPREYKICSECATEGHTWQNCSSQEKRCINCGDTHRSLAFKCPSRKAAIQKAKEAAKEKQAQINSYSSATSAGLTPPLPSQSYIKDSTAIIQTCLLHAMYKELGEPGTYNSELNKALKENNFPEVKLPSTPNVNAICGIQHPPSPTKQASSPTTNLIPNSPSPTTSSPAPTTASTPTHSTNSSMTETTSPLSTKQNETSPPPSPPPPASSDDSSSNDSEINVEETTPENKPNSQTSAKSQNQLTHNHPTPPLPARLRNSQINTLLPPRKHPQNKSKDQRSSRNK